MDSETLIKAVLSKIGKKYEFVKSLGGGAYSNVYHLKHTLFGEEHALKIMDYNFIKQKFLKDPTEDIKKKFLEVKERFIIEARMYKKLSHPNIVRIYDIDVIEDPTEEVEIPFFIMDYIKGSNLLSVIKNEAPLEIDRVLSISRDVLSALEAIHQNNIIHRDLKPGNILIEEATGRAVLIDLGIAKDVVVKSGLTSDRAFMGSPGYMAPEQFYEGCKVSPETDIYAFGIVFYEMLTGDLPFKDEKFLKTMNSSRKKLRLDVKSKNPSVTPGIDSVFSKAMAKDPVYRYKSAGEFLDAIRKLEKKKTSRNSLKYLVPLAFIILIAAFIFIDPVSLFNKNNHAIITPSLPEKINIPDTHPNVTAANEKKENIERKESNENKGKEDYQKYIAAARKDIQNGDFVKANESVQRAQDIQDTDEVKQLSEAIVNKRIDNELTNGSKEYGSIRDNELTLSKYLEFKQKYSNSIHIPDLIKRLKQSDKNLPPEKYWTDALKNNKKGSYEYTFGVENNGHTMIYIPEKRIWIDKYEVSNLQYRKFLKDEKIEFSRQTINKFIHNNDEYPVVVSYEDAERYSKKYKLRLPTVQEWEYAAGAGKNIYPWGDEPPDSGGIWRANIDTLENDYEQDGFKGTAPVRSFEKSCSPYGAFNMAGNVWEWVQGYILKGGGLFSDKEDLRIKKNLNGGPNDKEGFRCVKDEN